MRRRNSKLSERSRTKLRRAVEGVRRPVLHKGKPVYINGEILYQVEYSDRLLERLLEVHNPEKFGRRTENSVVFDGDINKLFAGMSDEQLKIATDRMLRDVYGNDSAAIEAAKQQILIEAGVVVIDAESTAVETQSTSRT